MHGFGFSFALRDTLQFAGSHLLTSLVSFNVGVELGQLLVLLTLVPALALLFRFAVAERAGTILLSALIAHTGWHWMIDRADRLRRFPAGWPSVPDAVPPGFFRWLALIALITAALWLMRLVFAARRESAVRSEAAEP